MSVVQRTAGLLRGGSRSVLLFLLPFSPAAIEVLFGVLLVSWLLQ